MKKLICCFMACLLIMSVFAPLLSAAAPSAVVEGNVNSSKWLTLSTNTTGARYVVDSNGEPVRLFGMARCQYHADEEDVLFSDTADVDALTEHYRELGCNIMRLAINCDDICREGGGVSEEEINRFISKNIDPDVQAIIRSGMYVMLDIHMYPPDAPEGVNDADYTVQYAYDNYLPMLTALAKKYADEPMIAVIEIWNEPYAADQEELEFDTDEWNSLVRQYFIDAVNEIRKYDERHILMVSDWNAGWGCALPETWDGYYDQLDPVYRNTAHSIHVAAEHMDTEFTYYKSWYKNLAVNKNICLIFGEIETEGDLMTTAGMQNLIQMFSDTKETHHFSGILWRPHGDEANYVDVWKDWAKEYATIAPSPEFREIIEAENFADKSETAELVTDAELYGAPSVGTGIRMLPNQAPNKYYEASLINNEVYEPGTYSLTVTALGDASNDGGFIVGYRTVSGKVVQLAEMKGNNKPLELYDQTISFTSDEQISSFVFFSSETEKKSVAIDRIYLVADSSYKATKKSKVTVAQAKTVTTLDGNNLDATADLSDMVVKAQAEHNYVPAIIIMGSVAAVLIVLLVANGIVLKKRKS